MTLDRLMIRTETQNLYAEIIAIEDISEGNETDGELLKTNNKWLNSTYFQRCL